MTYQTCKLMMEKYEAAGNTEMAAFWKARMERKMAKAGMQPEPVKTSKTTKPSKEE